MKNLKVQSICTVCRPWECLWVDSNGKNGKSTSHRGPIGHEFPRFVIISEISQPEVASRSRFRRQICVVWKKDPLRGNLLNSILKGCIATPIHVFVNFAKFGQPKIGKVVHYLPHKKNKIVPRSRFCVDGTQNLPGPAADNVLRVPQISFRSVHFWRSYIVMPCGLKCEYTNTWSLF